MRGFYILLGFNCLLLVSFMGEAKINGVNKSKCEDKAYIVYMGKTSFLNGTPRSDHAQLLRELKKRKKNPILQTYSRSFVGFAARLSEEEADTIAQRPGVVSVFPDQVAQPQTTRSWDFLTTQSAAAAAAFQFTPTTSQLSDQHSSSDIIIGIIDFGIWPQHPSFKDSNIGPIPPHWNGTCMPGDDFMCTNKVIGARYYDDPENPGLIVSARDDNGHGTHVASIAAGRNVGWASYYGLAEGTAKGGSQGARIAVYRVCGGPEGACSGSAIFKAFDDAIADGVDVISISLGLRSNKQDIFIKDPIIVGAFHAAEKGVVVVGSAGNRGPSPWTVEKFCPWIVTVAATSTDRDFEADILLGNNEVIKGGGINFSRLNYKFAAYPLVDGCSAGSEQADVVDAINCVPGSLDDDRVRGKIILCENRVIDERKLDLLKSQGAIGVILVDDSYAQVPFNFGTFPVAAVHEEDGAHIRFYINSVSKAFATILPTRSVIRSYKPAPVVALFSSRGPPAYGAKTLIKPDIAAPGLGILAAWPPFNDSSRDFPRKEPPMFNIDSGTSMSCPHVSGLVATVKSHHPTWTPDFIRSAIMTTATQKNNLNAPITTHTGSRATPYDIGSGQITLFCPMRPGLVFETKTDDYVQFLCNMGYDASTIKYIGSIVPDDFSCPSNSSLDLISDMNYPSIAVSGLGSYGSRTVTRTLTNVGEQYSTYTATVEAPATLRIQVVPKILRFTKTNKKLSYQVTFLVTTYSQEDLFGSITWCSSNYKVQSPFAVSSA